MSLKQTIKMSILTIAMMGIANVTHALELNVLKIGGDERDRLANVYSQAYGYPAYQVKPILAGPVGEAPAILQIAKSAGTLPLSVWTMRRMGMSYQNILASYALAPTIFAGSQALPQYAQWTDPMIIRTGRLYFIRDVIHVNPNLIPYFPVHDIGFISTLLYPYHPKHGDFLPPGIAKKYGLWIPPGQRKKMGWYPGWGHPGHGKKGHKGWGHPGRGIGKSGKGHHGHKGKVHSGNHKAFKGAKAKGSSFKRGNQGKSISKGGAKGFSGKGKSFGGGKKSKRE